MTELTRFELRNQALLERIANALEQIAEVLEKEVRAREDERRLEELR